MCLLQRKAGGVGPSLCLGALAGTASVLRGEKPALSRDKEVTVSLPSQSPCLLLSPGPWPCTQGLLGEAVLGSPRGTGKGPAQSLPVALSWAAGRAHPTQFNAFIVNETLNILSMCPLFLCCTGHRTSGVVQRGADFGRGGESCVGSVFAVSIAGLTWNQGGQTDPSGLPDFHIQVWGVRRRPGKSQMSSHVRWCHGPCEDSRAVQPWSERVGA